MPTYDFHCDACGVDTAEFRPMSEYDKPCLCVKCEKSMRRVLTFGVRGDYKHPIISDAMAIDPSEVAEHRRRYPWQEIRDSGEPVFRSETQKRRYHKEMGWHDISSYHA